MEKIVIIGANHAGTAAIKTILSNYKDKEVVVYDKNSNISFLGCGMALWIGEQISSGEGLFYSSKEDLESMGAKVNMNSEVKSVDFINKKIVVSVEGNDIEDNYDKLILATGSTPRMLDIEGNDLNNIQMVKLYQNAKEVIVKLEKEKFENVVVIGAGYIGVELAEAFKRLDKNVTLIDHCPRVLNGYYDDIFTDEMERNLSNHGINVALNETVIKFTGDENNNVNKVITDKKEYNADMVIMAVGFNPNTDIGKNYLKLYENGAYLTNKKCQTSDKDVYAIGDCATVYNNAIENYDYIALATNAVRSGIIAAHNVCGTNIESEGVQGSSAISIYNLNMVSTGLTVSQAKSMNIDVDYTDYEDTKKPAFMEVENPKVKIRIVYRKEDRVIVGTQIMSTYDISMGIHMFSLAIQEKLTIDKLALLDLFFLPHFNQPYNFITMAALNAK
ncbi:H2O-forming NADH oxidase [Miniphocaeibacter massiliensis]|uniref:H2O-forming NADH oxidase n=1 Tax=Miniphocaeibacter massiliensis TaxID=2041841 RepID=UPI000C07CBCB|nr:FAD-dependent oxidoreductase [Miniphocaeibacter massiliensis]